MIYPKVLIIGYPFDKNTGGGITMSNLFTKWPKDKLALASNANLIAESDTTVCEQFYQLGYNKKLHPFPLGLILPEIKCGPLKINRKTEIAESGKAPIPGKYKRIYNLLRIIMNFLGVYNFLYKLKITPEFKDWLLEFNPDVIYSQLSTLELIRFVQEVHLLTGKPVAIHMMDDWPLTINKPGLLYFYWKKLIDKEFRKLLDSSYLLMSICDAMSREYKDRYHKDFIPFHNPIDTSHWLPHSRKDYSRKGKFTLLYAGRIGLGMHKTIIEIAEVVDELSKTYEDIVFEIQTNNISEIKNAIRFNEHIKWVQPIPYADLPKKFSGADLLVLPVDFDDVSIRFMRFSFPTKISEYMISGTPVLVYADSQIALSKYASDEKWAYVVDQNDKTKLAEGIVALYSDNTLRKNLGERAKEMAARKEDAEIVRDEFRKSFILG